MAEHKSLVEKHLPPLLWEWSSKQTSHGTSFYDCISSAVKNPKSNVGLYAPDPEVYDTFPELFHKVIGEYHNVNVEELKSVHDLGNSDDLVELPNDYKEKVKSTRVRVGRTVKGYPMQAKLTREKRVELAGKIEEALKLLDGELAGTYYPLNKMSPDEKSQLIEEHILFNDAEDKCLADANGYDDWPNGRGIFYNKDKTFIVWVNEEDHIRIISMQEGASLKEVWARLCKGIKAMQEKLEFECHDKFGYLTFCPTNIGTGLRASVHVAVPLVAERGKLKELCAANHLQPRGVDGEHTESKGGVYDISNKIRIGRTEWDLINDMWNGVKIILDAETGKDEAKPEA